MPNLQTLYFYDNGCFEVFALNGSTVEDFSKFYFSKSSSLRPLQTLRQKKTLFREATSFYMS